MIITTCFSFHFHEKKEDNCFPRDRESELTEVTRRYRKKPEVFVSATSGWAKVICPAFFFSFFVEVDCKKGDNCSVANAKVHFQMPLSLSSTCHLSSSLTLPFVGEGKNTFNSNFAELLLASPPTSLRIVIGKVHGFSAGESWKALRTRLIVRTKASNTSFWLRNLCFDKGKSSWNR